MGYGRKRSDKRLGMVVSVACAAIGLPFNAASDRRYSGINILTLWHAVIARGFTGHGFLTFRQAVALGGSVRKGERGIGVLYTRRFVPREERRRADIEGREPSGGIPFLKWFTVFSVEQCDGLPAHIGEPPPSIPDGLILPQADALINATKADFRIGGPSAFYSPTHDYVQVPRPDDFHDPVNWHRTAFHELGHWAGGASRPGASRGTGCGARGGPSPSSVSCTAAADAGSAGRYCASRA